MIKVNIEKMYEDVEIPSYKHTGDSGMDIKVYLPEHKRGSGIYIQAQERVLIPTGIKVAIPDGYEIQVRPRSGLALKQGLTVLNTPGTVDSGYRGEIGVIVFNTTNEYKLVNHGDRIAQLVLCEVPKIEWNVVTSVDQTTRGDGGFGSTGVK